MIQPQAGVAAAPRPTWSTACPDWERRIVARQSLIPFPPLYPQQAVRALEVFKSLKIVDAPKIVDAVTGERRTPTFGDLAAQWVFDFVAAIFGAYDEVSGERLINEFFLLISKKNGKSTLAAGIMVTAAILNWRDYQELNILAPTITVAGNSYGPAVGMIRADEQLSDLFHVRDHLRLIKHRVTNAELKVIAADTETAGGSKSGFNLVDEIWIFGKRHNAKGMLKEALGGLSSRPEGFNIYLTTHSDEPAAGVMKEKLDYARAVRDGDETDPQFLPVLYEWPKAMLAAEAYLEPKNFYITNPNLDFSVRQEWLKAQLKKEQCGEGDGLQLFLAKHLNVEIEGKLTVDRWAGADHWPACADPSITLETLIERCEVVVAGIDNGGSDDLFGFTAAGREIETGAWLLWTRAFALKTVLKVRPGIASRLEDFAREGSLELCERGGDIIKAVCGFLKIIDKAGRFPEKAGIGVDAGHYGVLVDALEEIKMGPPRLLGVNPQAYTMNSAIEALDWKLVDREAAHDGSALMTWCVGNAKVEKRKNMKLITKEVSGAGKIDPLISALIAVKLLEAGPQAQSGPRDIEIAFS